MPYDYKGLESFYIRKLQILLSEKSRKKQSIGNSISTTNLGNIHNQFFVIFPVWQEIFDNGGTLHPETIIEVWKGWGRGWQFELNEVRFLLWRS